MIDEGPRYKVRDVKLLGNSKFGTPILSEHLKLKGSQFFDQMQMNKDVGMIRDIYGGQGYIFADVQADPRFLEEPGTLDLVYTISEGDRYRVSHINVHIEGDNPHTRNNTVLNRLSLRPGDVIDLNRLKQSERRLKASQLFLTDPTKGSAAKIVFSPPEGEDDDGESSVAGKPKKPRGSGFRGQSPDPENMENAENGEPRWKRIEVVLEPLPPGSAASQGYATAADDVPLRLPPIDEPSTRPGPMPTRPTGPLPGDPRQFGPVKVPLPPATPATAGGSGFFSVPDDGAVASPSELPATDSQPAKPALNPRFGPAARFFRLQPVEQAAAATKSPSRVPWIGFETIKNTTPKSSNGFWPKSLLDHADVDSPVIFRGQSPGSTPFNPALTPAQYDPQGTTSLNPSGSPAPAGSVPPPPARGGFLGLFAPRQPAPPAGAPAGSAPTGGVFGQNPGAGPPGSDPNGGAADTARRVSADFRKRCAGAAGPLYPAGCLYARNSDRTISIRRRSQLKRRPGRLDHHQRIQLRLAANSDQHGGLAQRNGLPRGGPEV